MSIYYILDDNKIPVPCDDIRKWAMWFETANRVVAQENIGPLRVSTVFLGLDHQFGNGPPLLFETMIFGEDPASDAMDSYCDRCSTWEQAEAMHTAGVAEAKKRVAVAMELVDSDWIGSPKGE